MAILNRPCGTCRCSCGVDQLAGESPLVMFVAICRVLQVRFLWIAERLGIRDQLRHNNQGGSVPSVEQPLASGPTNYRNRGTIAAMVTAFSDTVNGYGSVREVEDNVAKPAATDKVQALSGVSRRRFLGSFAFAGTGLAAQLDSTGRTVEKLPESLGSGHMKMKQTYDVVVVGGGPGGFSAALAAAKRGARVLLVERYGFLGGMATAGLVNPFMGYKLGGDRLTSSIFNEMLDRMEREEALDETEHVFDDEVMKFVLDEMVQHHGVELLLHSFFVGADVSGRRIQRIHTAGKSGVITVEGKVFVDATGDGDLAARAGAAVEKGRAADGLAQPMTLCFRMGGVAGEPPVKTVRDELTEVLLEAKAAREVNQPRENVLVFATLIPGAYHFNTTRIVRKDSTNTFEMTGAEIEARRQVKELVALFKQRVPRFKDAFILKMAAQTGVRESRRVMGEYVLDEADVLAARKFEDGIARSTYSIDIHNPTGEGTVIKRVPKGDYYEIPYRCLVPTMLDNLLVGSRCISSTHEAHSSLRIMPVVAGLGEAAGTAAAMAAAEGCAPHEVSGSKMKEHVLGTAPLSKQA